MRGGAGIGNFNLRFMHIKKKSLYAFAILTAFTVLQLFASLCPLVIAQPGVLSGGAPTSALAAANLSSNMNIPQLSRQSFMSRLMAHIKNSPMRIHTAAASQLQSDVFESYAFDVNSNSDISSSSSYQHPDIVLRL
jgi:hypothetical protein